MMFKCKSCNETSEADKWNEITDIKCDGDYQIERLEVAFLKNDLEQYYYYCPSCKKESNPIINP